MILSLLATLPLGAPVWMNVQDSGQNSNQPPVLSVDELVLRYYQPMHASAKYLAQTIERLAGRTFFVRERGGFSSEEVSDLFLMGSSVGIYDTVEYVERILALAKELDQRWESDGVPKHEIMSYTPRYLPLAVVERALKPFQRQIYVEQDYTSNMSSVRDRSVIIIRDTPARLAEIRQVLEALDVPEPQVLITCWMIDGLSGSGHDENLPTDLVENLQALLPGFGFQTRGFAMLQTTVSFGNPRIVELGDDRSTFSLHPTAYDVETGTLTVGSCTLSKPQTRGGDGRDYFTTSAIFRGGEYTVLGAVGSEPVFLVVRVTKG